MPNIECLRDCHAYCCKKTSGVTIWYDFSVPEAVMIEAAGAHLKKDEFGSFSMDGDCPFLQGDKCDLFEKPERPQTCIENRVEGKVCSGIRGFVENNAGGK